MPCEAEFVICDHTIQGLNRYVYARNNPLVITDPSGEIANFIVGGIVGGIAGVGVYTVHTIVNHQEWKLEKALVAGAGGAVVGAAAPLIAAGLASGAIETGALGILGVKGGAALATAEVAGFVGVLKYEANHRIDDQPIQAREAAREFVCEGAWGAVSGYEAGRDAVKAVGRGVLKPDAVLRDLSYWYYQDSLRSVPMRLVERFVRGVGKDVLHDFLFPRDVDAATHGGGGGGSWGGPPSQGK